MMRESVSLNDKVTFTAVAFVNVLTDFYDELCERGDEIHNYMDVVAIARETVVKHIKEQKGIEE